jgi:hypothetical protein
MLTLMMLALTLLLLIHAFKAIAYDNADDVDAPPKRLNANRHFVGANNVLPMLLLVVMLVMLMTIRC